jgi:hypothetical protein
MLGSQGFIEVFHLALQPSGFHLLICEEEHLWLLS